jgi:hypothetical protein
LKRQYRFFLKNFGKIRLISEKYRKHKISYSFISATSLLLDSENFLRCCPFWKVKNYCEAFDEKIQSTLKKIVNIKLSSNSWNQVSLPLDFGGLGIRIDRRTLSGSWS